MAFNKNHRANQRARRARKADIKARKARKADIEACTAATEAITNRHTEEELSRCHKCFTRKEFSDWDEDHHCPKCERDAFGPNVFFDTSSLDGVIRYLERLYDDSNQQIVVVMSGASGVGKSTFTRALKERVSARHASADDYFMKQGKYIFNRSLLSNAHTQCKSNCHCHLTKGARFVIVDNTNITSTEINAYKDIAANAGALMLVVSFELPDGISTLQASLILARRNAHNIQPSVINSMLNRHQYNSFGNLYPHVMHLPTMFTPKECSESQGEFDSLQEPTCTVQPAQCYFLAQPQGSDHGLLKARVNPDDLQKWTDHDMELPGQPGLTMAYNMPQQKLAALVKALDECEMRIGCTEIVVHADWFGSKVQFLNVGSIGISKSAPPAAIEFLRALVQQKLHLTVGVKNRQPYDAAPVHRGLDFPSATFELYD